MGAFLKLFLLALVLTIATTTASASFDYWKLALQWPSALGLGNQGPYVPNPPKFTIHELSHDNFTSTFTRCPVAQQPFNIHIFSSAIRNNQRFWTDEWKKHGGCSELQYDQLRYFELAADLYDQYFDIFGVLTRASIPRSYPNSVPLATINSSIIANTTKVPVLTCCRHQDPASGGWREILKEVRLCLDKQFVLIDCPPQNSYNDCIGPDIYFV